jgi:myotubularin-related protein 14
MVQKKNTLFDMDLTGSEKMDKYDRYRVFQMMLLPYPGCEHFRELVTQKYNGALLFYDWTLLKNDVILDVPTHLSSRVCTDWSFWRSWNSVDLLTKNYLHIILCQLETNKRGILIHCLSGWDRTPLFISLLRLSLWADGYIHQSLTVDEILYLTPAYDWYLFGHNLSEPLKCSEEILYFTLLVFPHLVENEFVFHPSNDSSESLTFYRKD